MKRRIFALVCALAVLLAGAAQADGARAAYRAALENLYNNHTFPDGYADDPFDVEGNGFAIYDVDGDGRDELLVQWDDTAVASWYGVIYDYDAGSGSLRAEYKGVPNFEIYKNGVLVAEDSHNQSPSKEVWPYSLYVYDPDADEYEYAGNASAWERDYSPDGFPSNVDANGDGMVYQCDGEWVDDDEYFAWYNSFLGGASEMRVPFMDLTPSNIRSIG